MNRDAILQLVLDSGADHAAIVSQEQIILSDTFRDICRSNQCGRYGKCWVCPPDVGEIHKLMARVRSFEIGVLYQSISRLNDSFDLEGMQRAGQRQSLLEQRIQYAILSMQLAEFMHLGGGCRLCKQCTKQNDLPCRFPEKVLFPMESCGINVSATTKSTPLHYINGVNTITYFGLLLFREN